MELRSTANMTPHERACEIMRLTRLRLARGITQAELAAAVNEILTHEPELPLGIGAATELRGQQR